MCEILCTWLHDFNIYNQQQHYINCYIQNATELLKCEYKELYLSTGPFTYYTRYLASVGIGFTSMFHQLLQKYCYTDLAFTFEKDIQVHK